MFGNQRDVSPYPYQVIGLFFIKAMPEKSWHTGDGAGIIVYRAQQTQQHEVFQMYDEIRNTVDPNCLNYASQGAHWPGLPPNCHPQRGKIVGVFITAPVPGRDLAAAMGRVLRYTKAPTEIPAEFVPSSPFALAALVELIYCFWNGRCWSDSQLSNSSALKEWWWSSVGVLDDCRRIVSFPKTLAASSL